MPSRYRLALIGVAAIVLIAALVSLLAGSAAHRHSAPPQLPVPGIGHPARPADPFAYVPSRQAEFESRAAAGSAHILFTKSPGGVLATARRVAAFRASINAATAGTGIDPNILEAIVFVESAGRPEVIAGPDPSAAAGLTQILAQTGRSLLGMSIDLPQSRRLTAAIGRADAVGRRTAVRRLQDQRAKLDVRFDPRKALAATVRYLELAQGRFGRPDLAVVSYHMGIGNLQQVLDDYDGGRPVPYAQLYFDTAPDRHAAAYGLLSSFGDDSSLYYWRVLGAAQIMRLYRADPGALRRLVLLQTATGSGADVLHPPDQAQPLPHPDALYAAYASHAIVPLPANASSLGLTYDRSIGALAPRLGVPARLYRGLRPQALDLLIELAARVRALSGGAAPLTVTSAVSDVRYQQLLGISDVPAASGYSFTIARRYVSRAQAVAFQSMLDRLQALDLIAWIRYPAVIEVTVASDASAAIANGP